MLRPVLFLVGGLAMLSSCAYDNAEELFANQPTPDCEVASTTYATTIAPILAQNCRTCHNTQLPSGNVALDSYAQVKRYADNGLLVGVVSHANGFDPMPQGMPKLSDCDIARIKKWVDDKAPNN
ncbi:c-type cytochrome [Hymenobacter lucidus]|uniref:Cytochrome c n=1 Tax=Hymenobacter lucidus TaxID=2880930 RepID=A0ABS8AN78_9BACT|nr:cytochrome c [Hymenobacter lucidus]MCB2407209.1 cytochrome c [Hymenobacter lucidus]